MKVYRIGQSEQDIIIEALEALEESQYNMWNDMEPGIEKDAMDYQLSHTRTTKALLKDQCLQELVERVLGYYADRLFDGGSDEWPEIEGLSDDMGMNDEKLKLLFREAGYGEEN